MWVSGCNKCSFFEKFGVLCLLVIPVLDSLFFLITDNIIRINSVCIVDFELVLNHLDVVGVKFCSQNFGRKYFQLRKTKWHFFSNRPNAIILWITKVPSWEKIGIIFLPLKTDDFWSKGLERKKIKTNKQVWLDARRN